MTDEKDVTPTPAPKHEPIKITPPKFDVVERGNDHSDLETRRLRGHPST